MGGRNRNCGESNSEVFAAFRIRDSNYLLRSKENDIIAGISMWGCIVGHGTESEMEILCFGPYLMIFLPLLFCNRLDNRMNAIALDESY